MTLPIRVAKNSKWPPFRNINENRIRVIAYFFSILFQIKQCLHRPTKEHVLYERRTVMQIKSKNRVLKL